MERQVKGNADIHPEQRHYVCYETVADIIKPNQPFTRGDAKKVQVWLDLIEETHPEAMREIANQCNEDAEAREWFLTQADNAIKQKQFVAA